MAFGSQRAYDSSRARLAIQAQPPSAAVIRSFDLGLHSAVASFLWLDVRTELPFLRQGLDHFLSGLKTVNDLDPHWNTPYAFAVLVLPNIPSRRGFTEEALAIGERGLASADPDWRIPFYMGTAYLLELNDHANAAKYFDIAAATPGVPEIIRRFAVNYGIHPDSIEATRQAWVAIYETSSDASVRERAAAHIAHLDILEGLNMAVRAFHGTKGRYPSDLEEVLAAGFLTEIPRDPFGFNFKIYEGGVVGIAP
jgi:hypothetical protein